MATSRSAPKFSLKPSALSQHTANFNKLLEQVPTPKVDSLELIKPIPEKFETVILANNEKKDTQNIENEVQKKEEKNVDVQIESAKPSSSSTASETKPADSPVKGFVFGEKLTDRVTFSEHGFETNENGTSPAAEGASSNNVSTTEASAKQPLWPVSEDQPNPADEINDADTIIRLNCKLFVLTDKVNWTERGYGLLKLINSNDGINCNIMMWTDKCYRLILNSKLFEKMQIDRANKKSIRLNAFDNGTIKIFLIKATNPNDCDELYEVLTYRLNHFLKYAPKTSPSSKDSSSKLADAGKKSIVFTSDCDLVRSSPSGTKEDTYPSKIILYSQNPPSDSSNHQLYLDLVDRENDSKTRLCTFLKFIEINKSKPNEEHDESNKKDILEFEIAEQLVSFMSPELNPKSKSKYMVMLDDKELALKFLALYHKEPKISNLDESSSDEDDERQSDSSEDEQNNDNEILRKTGSINESERNGSSDDDETANDSSSQLNDTGEPSRKRKNDDSENIPNAFKRQELETSQSSDGLQSPKLKRNLEECSSSNGEEQIVKKTKVDD